MLPVWLEEKLIPEPNTGCHLWLGPMLPDGYGLAWDREKKKNVKMHRLVFRLTRGFEPICVCHACDVRCCGNPDHLFAGTHQTNTDDMIRKGRSRGARPGVDHHNAKLTVEQVLAIRASQKTLKAIGEEFGIHFMHAHRIRRGSRWKGA